MGMGNRLKRRNGTGRDERTGPLLLPTIPDSRFPEPGYLGANRIAPSTRIVPPLR